MGTGRYGYGFMCCAHGPTYGYRYGCGCDMLCHFSACRACVTSRCAEDVCPRAELEEVAEQLQQHQQVFAKLRPRRRRLRSRLSLRGPRLHEARLSSRTIPFDVLNLLRIIKTFHQAQAIWGCKQRQRDLTHRGWIS